MRLFPRFNRKKREQKSSQSLDKLIREIGKDQIEHSPIGIRESLDYYNQVSPLAISINKLASEGANVNLSIFDGEVFTENHPLLDLLGRPSADITKYEFFYNSLAYFLVTGNLFWHVTSKGGNPDSEILELSIIKPQNVSIRSSDNITVESYDVTMVNKKSSFKRQEDINGLRFFDNNGNELWHVRRFNPGNSPYGASPLTHIFHELRQFIESSKHNTAFFVNGASPGGLLLPDTSLTADERECLRKEFTDRYTGAANNKRWLFGAGLKDVKQLSSSIKDMDFVNLRTALTQSIYNLYDIPLALLDPSSMKFRNVDNGKLMLYDNAVLPSLNRLLDELTNFVIHRYPDIEEQRIFYNQKNISALQDRFLDQAKVRTDIGVETVNEIRNTIGLESIDGGEVFPQQIVPSNLPQTEEKALFDQTFKNYDIDREYLSIEAKKAGL